MAKQTFTTGQVLTAAQVNSLQANDFNQTVSVKTANYTLAAADKGTRIEFNTSGSVTCTVNSGLFDAGDTLVIQNRGAGTATITAGTATVNTSASLALAQYSAGTLYFVSDSAALFFGDAAGISASIVDAKGDLIVGTADNTVARLAVGTNGHTLVADSSVSPTGLKWAVDPVADVVTTAGDLLYATAADTVTRLGIGTAGQVLKVNSGATAPEWGAAAAGGADWSLLNSGGTALTGATTVTVSGISGKDKIIILISGASADASDRISVRLNTDTGSNYAYFGSKIDTSSTYSSGIFLAQQETADTSIPIGKLANNAASTVSGYVLLSGCNSSGVKQFHSVGGRQTGGGTGGEIYSLGGYYNSASTISSISVRSDGANLDAGTVYVYTSA